MSKKHNTKHRRSGSSYKAKIEGTGSVQMKDVQLSDGKRASVKR